MIQLTSSTWWWLPATLSKSPGSQHRQALYMSAKSRNSSPQETLPPPSTTTQAKTASSSSSNTHATHHIQSHFSHNASKSQSLMTYLLANCKAISHSPCGIRPLNIVHHMGLPRVPGMEHGPRILCLNSSPVPQALLNPKLGVASEQREGLCFATHPSLVLLNPKTGIASSEQREGVCGL